VALLSVAATAGAMPPAVEQQPVRVKNSSIDVRVQQTPTEKLEVLARDGTKLPGAITGDAGQPVQVSIPKGKPVVIRTESARAGAPLPLPLPSKETALDSVLVENVAVAGSETMREIRQWTLLINASQTPLVWNATRRAYTTELLVRLKDLGAAIASRPSSPVIVQLVGKGLSIEPQTLRLSESGVSGIQRALVALSNHRTEGIALAISDFGEQSYSVAAGPELATLDLKSLLTAFPGFGIGSTTVIAVRRAEDGLELAHGSPLQVALTASGGRFSSPLLLIPANASRSQPVELRSAWLGQATISAEVDGIEARPLELEFTTPWSYFVAILLGAALGSFIRVRPKTKAQRYEFLAGVGVGVVLGLGSFVGITAAIQLPATAVVTELGCLLVAAIEAYVGRAALDRYAGRAAET
jgi:hypothetical protein